MTNDPGAADKAAKPARQKRSGQGITRSELEERVRARREQFDEVNEKIAARTGRNLVSAIAIGLGLGLIMLFSLLFFPVVFFIFVGVLVCITSAELSAPSANPGATCRSSRRSCRPQRSRWRRSSGASKGQWLILLAGSVFVFLWRLAELAVPKYRAGGSAAVLRDLAAGFFVQAYVVFLGSISILLVGQATAAGGCSRS